MVALVPEVRAPGAVLASQSDRWSAWIGIVFLAVIVLSVVVVAVATVGAARSTRRTEAEVADLAKRVSRLEANATAPAHKPEVPRRRRFF